MRKSVLFGLAALLASLVPAFAGEVYVPYASNQTINQTLYQTKVWVTNPGTDARTVGVRFIQQGIDGTKTAGKATNVALAAGATVLLTNIAPDGTVGMLELTGPPQLVVAARLQAFAPGGAVLSSTDMPAAAVANAIAAKTTAYLQGIERTSRGTITDFGVLNLSRTSTQCTIKTLRTNAQSIAQTALITLLPLSVRTFSDVLSLLGQTSVTDAHIEVTCDQQFYPYALVYEIGGPESSFVAPSNSLAGDLVPSGGGGTTGDFVYTQAGTFLHAVPSSSYVEYELPLPAGVKYTRAIVEYDLFVAKFPDGLFAGVTSLRRRDHTLYYGLIIRGDRQKTILDMGLTDDVVTGGNGTWDENTNYHLKFVYDTAARNLNLTVTKGGTVVQNLSSGHINHFDLSNNGKTVTIDFGQDGIADGAYFPPIGWSFSNLKVTFQQ
jgi:hypothetical protein